PVRGEGELAIANGRRRAGKLVVTRERDGQGTPPEGCHLGLSRDRWQSHLSQSCLDSARQAELSFRPPRTARDTPMICGGTFWGNRDDNRRGCVGLYLPVNLPNDCLPEQWWPYGAWVVNHLYLQRHLDRRYRDGCFVPLYSKFLEN